MRKATVWYLDTRAGVLEESDEGYRFTYDPGYLALPGAQPVSLALGLQSAAFEAKTLFAFLDGLIPEG
jgi:serine/threonine-protein kinase HipA